MIVKVQLSLAQSGDKTRCLIYDRRREFMVEDEASDEVLRVMKGRNKAYFEVETMLTGLHFGREVIAEW